MRSYLVGLCSFALCACVTHTSNVQLGELDGHWRGTGTFQGMPSNVEATFSRSSRNELALQIDIVASRLPSEPVRFSGRGHYIFGPDNRNSGTWTDSMGSDYSILPRVENDGLVVDWGANAPARGRSEYRLQADGDLQIDDFAPNSRGEMRRFATAELKRVR